MEHEGMREEEFEAIKGRVQAAIAADGSIKATMAGQNYLGQVGRDIKALIAAVSAET